MEPKREDKRKRRKRKKRQAMLAKALPVVVAIVLIILIVGIFYGETLIESVYYTSERVDLNQHFEIVDSDDVAMLWNNTKVDEKATLIDGVCYFDMETVAKYFTDRFYVNTEEGIVLYTTATDIYKTYIGDDFSSYYISDAENSISYPAAVMQDETVYLAVDYVKIFADFSYEYFTEPNRMMVYTEWGSRQSASIIKETKLRYQGGVKSPILKDLSEGETVYILEEMETWTKVITEDALIGYVENKRLELGDMIAQTPATGAVELGYQSISREGKINMAFHQVFVAEANNTYDSYTSGMKSVNVIAPTWFRVLDDEGTLQSIASSSYVDKAHNDGLEVWAVVTDVDYKVNMEAILASSEKRAKLVSDLMSYALDLGLDGINIDFETVLDKEYGDDFAQFLRELSIQTHANNIVLSVDNYPPTVDTMHYDREEQGLVADYVVIMGYDEHWSTSKFAGSVASIDYVENGILKTMEEVPAEKIINAIPFFTRLWKTEGGEVSNEVKGMDSAQNWVDTNGVEVYWDNETCQYYGEIQKDNVLYQIWLEEEESIQVKLNVMDANNLAGVAEWKLGFERDSVWDNIESYMNS